MSGQKVEFVGAFTKLRKATINFVMSVCLYGTARLPLDGFFMKFDIDYFSKNKSRKLNFD
jgi:hypothetical protein